MVQASLDGLTVGMLICYDVEFGLGAPLHDHLRDRRPELYAG